ncbi:MAG: heavy metal-responsive transcriptional regulator [Acidobacteria bacterium]|nr:heavy metal-responsive transcriptional regulator [Acidobacteriota bacterium]
MRIGELADDVAITTEAVRYYEKVGLLTAPTRTPSGYRDYDHQALERLRFIRTAQTVGFSLGEIGEILALRDDGETPCDHVRQLIAKHAADLQQRIEGLQAMQADLHQLAAVAAAAPPSSATATHCHILESAGPAST